MAVDLDEDLDPGFAESLVANENIKQELINMKKSYLRLKRFLSFFGSLYY